MSSFRLKAEGTGFKAYMHMCISASRYGTLPV